MQRNAVHRWGSSADSTLGQCRLKSFCTLSPAFLFFGVTSWVPRDLVWISFHCKASLVYRAVFFTLLRRATCRLLIRLASQTVPVQGVTQTNRCLQTCNGGGGSRPSNGGYACSNWTADCDSISTGHVSPLMPAEAAGTPLHLLLRYCYDSGQL